MALAPDHRSRSSSTVVELLSGVDALYLSGRADWSSALVDLLEAARARAVESGVEVLDLGGEEFGVRGHGFGKYRYCLDHPSGRFGLTTSERLPSLRVQPRAEFLHGLGPRSALSFFEGIGEHLAQGPVTWSLSRIDLFCDVQGWDLCGDDRHRFVCRAARRDLHEEGEAFTGFEFGRRSTKTVCARIYDKTAQVRAKGLDWWPTMWGDPYDPGRPVLRVEVEVNREGLREFGIDSPAAGLERAAGVWAGLTEDWLSFRTPNGDATRSRWPVAPEWRAIQGASLRCDAAGLDRVRAGRRAGDLRRLTPALVGYLARVGAIVGTPDLSSTLGAVRRLVANDEERRGVTFEERVAALVAEQAYR